MAGRAAARLYPGTKDFPHVDEAERDEVLDEFREAVNLTPKELEDWLDTEESASVGDTNEEESTGHQMGRRILGIKHKKKAEYTADDYGAMKKVNGYVARHSKQGPDDDAEHSRWRYSLMNWGHDPLKGD